MRSKQAKICSLILATAVSSIFSTVSYTAKAVTEKNNIIYVTNKDVKNGKVVISNKTAQSIVIKKSVKKATIQLKGVKLSSDLTVEKGDYVLKTSRTKIKSLKISGKNTNIKLDKSSDLNKRNFVLKIAKNTTGNLDLSELGKTVTAELGKNSGINITVGNNDKASVVIKKASVTSKLGLVGTGEGASISKIRVESPVKLTVKVNATILETVKKADKAEIAIESKVAEVKNEVGALVQDKEAERQKAEKEKEEKAREEKAKEDKAKEEKLKEEKAREANNNAGGSYTPGITEKKTTAIALSKEGGELDEDGKAITIKVAYTPADATNKNLDWAIKEGSDKVRIISSNSNEAKIEALDNGAYKIEAKVKGSDVKAEISGNVTNQGDKAFEKRIDEYLKFTVDKINKDNYEDIRKMGADLVVKIDEKIGATSGTEKAKWTELKTKVTNKQAELAQKIDAVETSVETAKNIITAEYAKINTVKPEAWSAKEAVDKIEEARKSVSEKVFKTIVTDFDGYNAICAEVKELSKLVRFYILMGSNGRADFASNQIQTVDVSYKLLKTFDANGSQLNPAAEVKKGTLSAGTSSIDLRKEMRNSGVGKYKLVLYKELVKLKDAVVAETNTDIEVKLLEKNWGNKDFGEADYKSPKYYYDGAQLTLENGSSDKIKLEKVNGKWIMKWEAVENATSYDIIGELAFGNNECNLGAFNLNSSEADNSNIENEFEYSSLDNLAAKVNENKNSNKRTMVAVNHTSTSIELNNFVPVKGDNVKKDFWTENKDVPSIVSIWIIPRNQNSLYISNMKDYLSNPKSIKAKQNKFHLEGNPQSKFTVKDFYEMFYGEAFPTTP